MTLDLQMLSDYYQELIIVVLLTLVTINIMYWGTALVGYLNLETLFLAVVIQPAELLQITKDSLRYKCGI